MSSTRAAIRPCSLGHHSCGLGALGGALPGARLTGSLDAPELRLPELGDIATKLLEQQAKQFLEGNITEGLKGLFGGRKKKKDRD